MIKGAIFDVDGTLLDSMEIWENVGARYLRRLQKEPEENLSEILFPMTVEEGAIYVKRKYGLSQSVPQIVAGVFDTVRDFYACEAPLKAGVREFLESLSAKEIPMTVATSTEREHIEAAFERLQIRQYFQAIFTCPEVGAGKTRPVIYEKASACLGTVPRETYVFEDVIYAIRTAKRAGFQTVGVYDRFSEDDQEEIENTADIYLANLTEFWEYASVRP